MLEKVFSVAYAPGRQQDFIHALEKERYADALYVLRATPPGATPEEKLERVIMLEQGYRALSERLVDRFENTCERLGVHDLEELEGRLDDISAFDEEIKEYKEIVKEYDEKKTKLNTFTSQLKGILDRLSQL